MSDPDAESVVAIFVQAVDTSLFRRLVGEMIIVGQPFWGLVFGISGVPCGLIEQKGDQHISQGGLSMRHWPMTIAST
ncbi:hypothetical protein ASPVEDRAFT_43638 [Aspergillus versicolor CBS 583.65]|uniref:Uncharacterized protein n=1 Tax=Aspergillus versicolor CBS 583.65 TaxID=1036611 RepID=A0A1L9PRT6_ASPVE|nr:uncharacterized protein ASPVEDRAFT_43638 [Aspergillus versicolor CBS 583.65]OJJ04172.1 hypothetical protein ASPVEDRAFT_43638 [Aspergillus versicolor CBS 583.65]